MYPRDAEKINFDNYERGKQDVFLYHEEHLPYKTTIRKMRPPVSIEIDEGNFSQVLFEKVRFLKRPNFLPLFEMEYLLKVST